MIPGIAPLEESRRVLEAVCKVLNSEPAPELTILSVRLEPSAELRSYLREMVRKWLDSGPNLDEMNLDLSFLSPFVEKEESPPSFGWSPYPLPSTAIALALTTLWTRTSGPRARLWLIPNFGGLENTFKKPVTQTGPDGEETLLPDAAALVLFHLLTLTPGCERIAGPCARCDRYYIKKRASQTVYCSRRCGNAATAVARTKKRIGDERKDKINRAKAAIKKWKTSATPKDWKHWVAEKTGIDQRFLTRAVTNRYFIPPKKEK